jgi:hypothetical protein
MFQFWDLFLHDAAFFIIIAPVFIVIPVAIVVLIFNKKGL